MDKLERAQIRLLLDHLGAECRAKSAEKNKALHAQHSAKHILQSGATVKAAIWIAEELASSYVKDVVAAVSDVAMDIEAFNMIVADVTIMFQSLQPEIDQAVKFATMRDSGGAQFDSVTKEANRLFQDLKTRTLRLLEIHRFSFTHPSPSKLAELRKPILPRAQPQQPKNKGGKPLAAHWDQMWAAIAFQLWEGELKPSKQKDISEAMLAWFVAHEIDVGSTAVTDRARALWQLIEAKRMG